MKHDMFSRCGGPQLCSVCRDEMRRAWNEEETVYNDSNYTIFITRQWHADPNGGPAFADDHICLRPGQAVTLGYLGLSLKKPSPKPQGGGEHGG